MKKIFSIFRNTNKTQKILILSLSVSLIITFVSITVSQTVYNLYESSFVLMLLISLLIASCSFMIIIIRFLSKRISNNERLMKMWLSSHKTLFIYSMIILFTCLSVILLDFTTNSTIFRIILFSTSLITAVICGLITVKFLFKFKLVRRLLVISLISIMAVLFVYLLVLRPHKLVGNSMLPTLKHNNLIYSLKLPYYLSKPKRGDIVIFKSTISGNDSIGRIIGLPEEVIFVKDGSVNVNDNFLIENYLFSPRSTKEGVFLREAEPYNIPFDEYFIMGDNRENSFDSRMSGPVQTSYIQRKAWIKYWPFEQFGEKVD